MEILYVDNNIIDIAAFSESWPLATTNELIQAEE